MPLVIHLPSLELEPGEFQGQLSLEELDMDTRDELILASSPLHYDLRMEFSDTALQLTGQASQRFRCECCRCLKTFDRTFSVRFRHRSLPLQGEDALEVNNEHADLTPVLREDILLSLPSHPVCEDNCPGIKGDWNESPERSDDTAGSSGGTSVWSELDRWKPE